MITSTGRPAYSPLGGNRQAQVKREARTLLDGLVAVRSPLCEDSPDVVGRPERLVRLLTRIDARGQSEHTSGVEPQDLRARPIRNRTHLALDRSSRMRPGTFVVRVIVRPHHVIDQAFRLDGAKPDMVLLKRREAMLAELLRRKLWRHRSDEEVMGTVGVVLGFEQPRYEADPGFDQTRTQALVSFEDPR